MVCVGVLENTKYKILYTDIVGISLTPSSFYMHSNARINNVKVWMCWCTSECTEKKEKPVKPIENVSPFFASFDAAPAAPSINLAISLVPSHSLHFLGEIGLNCRFSNNFKVVFILRYDFDHEYARRRESWFQRVVLWVRTWISEGDFSSWRFILGTHSRRIIIFTHEATALQFPSSKLRADIRF